MRRRYQASTVIVLLGIPDFSLCLITYVYKQLLYDISFGESRLLTINAFQLTMKTMYFSCGIETSLLVNTLSIRDYSAKNLFQRCYF